MLNEVEIDINQLEYRQSIKKEKMANPSKNSNWGVFYNPEYSRLNYQIEQETKALLKERNQLRNPSNAASSLGNGFMKPVVSESQVKRVEASDRSSFDQKNLLYSKVRELAEMCKIENIAIGDELLKVLTQEKEIHRDLADQQPVLLPVKSQHYAENPIMEAQKQSSYIQGSRNSNSGIFSPEKQNIRSSVRQTILKNPKIQGSDEIIQMIEEIERKALSQIQKLREDKISLMKQLKSEIHSHNELQKEFNGTVYSEQRRNTSAFGFARPESDRNHTPFKKYQEPASNKRGQQETFEKIREEMQSFRLENDHLRQLLQTGNHGPTEGNRDLNKRQKNESENGQILHLENEVRKRDQAITHLVNEINSQGITPRDLNNPQLAQLLEQGEVIRLNTMNLLRNAQRGNGNSSDQLGKRVRELEAILEREQGEKQSFLDDLLAFKEKYQRLEDENSQLRSGRNYRNSGYGADNSRFSQKY